MKKILKVKSIKFIIIMIQYILFTIWRVQMNKYKRANNFKRIICLIIAFGMIITTFMSMLIYFIQ